MRSNCLQTILRVAVSWQFFLGLYAALTAWVFVGGELVPEPLFAGFKNAGYLIVMVVGFAAFRDGFVRSRRMTSRRPFLSAGMVLLGLALMGTASVVSQAVVLFIGAPATGENQAAISAEALAASTSWVGGLLFVGVGGCAAPVVEELVFRELPFGRLRHVLSTRTAIILSCSLFGVVHLRGLDEWPLMILYIGFSVALMTTYLLSKRNLLVAVTAHGLWNGIGLVYLLVTAT